MPKFFVKIKEIHTAAVEIEADNAEEAVRIAEEDHCGIVETHYDYTTDSDEWTVFDETGCVVENS